MRERILYIAMSTLLLAQTSSTSIDLTPIVSILMSILPLFLMLMVFMLIFKFLGSIFEGFSKTFFVKLAPAVLLAQTTTTNTTNIDLTPVTNMLFAILPLFITLMIIVIIFKFFGGMVDVFSRGLRAVKLNLAKAAPLLLLAQTTTNSVDLAQHITGQLSPVLMTLITIIIIIAIPLLIFKVLAKIVLETIRG